ncbi:MAG: sensor domain-containing diguanylate cyclase [Nocardioidaceae bacterium]|nr:sensor domain-containing diguanylate cyclase [Nocardioidaceae bacterium]
MRTPDQGDHGSLSEESTFARACEDVLSYLSRAMPMTSWSVARLDDHQQTQLFVVGDAFNTPGATLPAEQTLCHRMLDGAPRVVSDAAEDVAYRDVARPLGIRGYTSVPIALSPREPVGSLCGLSDVPIDVGAIDRELLEVLAKQLSMAYELSQRTRVLDLQLRLARDAALTDVLTGALNRRGWNEVAQEAARRVSLFGDRFEVLAVDLDGLKRVNDAHGHAAGDQLLRDAADTMRSLTRQDDSVARIGGDEFVLMLAANFHRAGGEALASRLRDGLAAAGTPASVGWSTLEPDEDPAEALARADRGMYVDKRGRSATQDAAAAQAGTSKVASTSS